MLTPVVQRWRSGRDSYRPAREVIDTRTLEVEPIADDKTAKRFVCEHHYSGSYPAARFRIGLYQRAELVGVAVFSVPAQPKCLDILPGAHAESVELGRFVLLDHVGANAESWMLARCFELLRAEHITGVVSFSDPVPRTSADGHLVFPGHIGCIYQATNGIYVGRSKPRLARLLPDGTVLHERSLAKIRRRDRGWRYAAALLAEHGAEPLGEREDPRSWLGRWLPVISRPLRHGGNHKYVWSLSRRLRKHLPPGRPYPKLSVAIHPDSA